MIRRLKPQSEFGRNVLTLMTGTTIAQAVPIAISPILTRIYTPEDFGVLAMFIAITSVLGAVATLRYELAIIQPFKEEDAASIVVLSALIAMVLSIFLLCFVFVCNEQIQHWLNNKEIGSWLYLIPVSVFLTGIYQSLNYWYVRKKHFDILARGKVYQGVSTGGMQIVSGTLIIGSAGLLWGYVIGQFIFFITLVKRISQRDVGLFRSVSLIKIKENLVIYKKMPQYSTLGALADNLSLQMPILVISKFYEMSQTGIFSLTFKVLNLPLSLLSGALSQVLFQKVSDMHHASPHDIKKMIIKLFLLLIALISPFVVFIWLLGDDLFAFVFGEPWRQAGSMASVLVLAVAIRFAVSPLSSVLALEHNVKLGVLWQIVYLITLTTTLVYFSVYSIDVLLLVFVVHEVLLYLLYLGFILKGSSYLKVN